MFKVACKDGGKVYTVYHVKNDDRGVWFLVYMGGYWSYLTADNFIPVHQKHYR